MRRNLLLIIFCVFLQIQVNGQTFTYTPASGSFIVPAAAGGLSVKVQAWGGGGAGGGATGFSVARCGAGGGGGGYAESTFTVSSGASLNIAVAGSVNGSSGADGSNGFDSVVTGFSSDVKAFGGKGGKANTAGGAPVGGTGGTFIGVTGVAGDNGGNGNSGLLSSSGAGGKGAGVAGGAGGAAIASNILANSSGNDGASPGGGGSGAVATLLGSSYTGGAGAAGKVVIGYTCLTNYNSLTSPATGTSACPIIGTSTITLTSSTGLPVGTYTVTYNTSLPSQTGLKTIMTVSVAGTGTFTATGLTTAGNSTITVTKLESGPCFTTIDTNNIATVVVNTSPAITVQPMSPAPTCVGAGTQTISVTVTGAGLTYSWRKDGVAVSNSAVIGGQGTSTLTLTNPIAADEGSYDVVVSGTCTPAIISNTVTVKIITALSDPGGISVNWSEPSAISTYCASSSAVFSIAAVTNATSYTWIVPNGWRIESGQGSTVVTVTTGTSAQSGYVSVYASNSCGDTGLSYQAIGLSTILPIAPTIALVRPDCTNPTGTITVNKPIPTTGIVYTITGTNPVVAPVSNSTGVFAGLPTGVYAVTYQNGSGCVSTAQTVSIQTANSNTWDGVKWSKTLDTTPPTSGDVIIFNGNYNLNVDIEGCACQVNAGFTVTIPSGKTMIITNSVNNEGTLIFEDGASLVQFNDTAVNSGSIIYKRISAPMKNFDFTYWSSPVKDQVLNVLSPNTLWDKYYSFNNGGWVIENGANKMAPAGKGFIIRVPKPGVRYSNGENWYTSTYAQPVEFVGIPNNGFYIITAQGDGKNNLVGNPYPSAIDADLFINENESVIGGALYFWTHNTAITQSGSFYVYSSSDYATYTLTGGTGTSMGNFVDTNNNGVWDSGEVEMSSNKPSGKIAAGQSFFVRSSASGDFKFKNSMRISASGSNGQFFKLSQTKKMTAKIEKNRVWLNLSNSDGAFKQMLVGYITGATNGMDNLYDGISYDGNSYIDFYSVNKEKKLTIQGRALPFDKTDKVPLGYRSTIEGTFTISIDKVDGILANQSVFIEDNVTKILHNLKEGTYSFTTAKGTFDDRFVLVYVDKNAVVTETPVEVNSPINIGGSTIEQPIDENKNKEIIVSVKNHLVKINSFDQIIESVLIYDLRGRKVYETSSVKSNQCVIYGLSPSEQLLVVKIQLTDAKWITKKIFLKK